MSAGCSVGCNEMVRAVSAQTVVLETLLYRMAGIEQLLGAGGKYVLIGFETI